MPLIQSPSKKAFQKNVETEMNANPGKSNRAQNLAIAYSTMRKNKGKKMAMGGEMESGYEDMPHPEMDKGDRYDDLVDRAIEHMYAEGGCMYSEGGMVADGGDADMSEMADGKPNNFDDLALRDGLEEHYTGVNSGDEHGNAQEDEDRHDIVARVMRKMAKQHNPRPA